MTDDFLQPEPQEEVVSHQPDAPAKEGADPRRRIGLVGETRPAKP
jgi:hypothetical protein